MSSATSVLSTPARMRLVPRTPGLKTRYALVDSDGQQRGSLKVPLLATGGVKPPRSIQFTLDGKAYHIGFNVHPLRLKAEYVLQSDDGSLLATATVASTLAQRGPRIKFDAQGRSFEVGTRSIFGGRACEVRERGVDVLGKVHEQGWLPRSTVVELAADLPTAIFVGWLTSLVRF